MAQNDLRFVISAADHASAPIDSVNRKLGSLGTFAMAASTSVNRAMGGMAVNVRGAAKQIGYQVADAAVQIQSGTHALMVFGQQGSQILSIFGPVGALIGAGVAVFSAFGYAALRAAEGTKEAADAMDSLNRKLVEAQNLARFGVTDKDELAILVQMDQLTGQIAEKEKQRAELATAFSEAHHRAAPVIAYEAERAAVQSEELRSQLETLQSQYDGYKDALGILNNIQIRQNGIDAALIAQWETIKKQREALELVAQGYSMVEVAAIDAARASAVAASSANQPFIPASGLGTYPTLSPSFESSGRMGSSAGVAPTILPTLDQIIAKYADVGSAGSSAVKDIADATEELTEASIDYAGTIESELNTAFSAVLDGTATLGDALLDFASNVLEKIAQDLFAQQFATPIADVLGGMIGGIVPSANGNVFDSGGLVPFAKGGVVSGPTVFPFANGTGLMGEAGPEAIMPLSRGPGGRLGVDASGAGVSVIVNNYTGQPIEKRTDGAGNTTIDIGKAVANDIASGGATYRAIKKTFGINSQLQLRG